jgi:hypothetical protein
MSNIDEQLRGHGKLMCACASEAEQKWRAAHGLTKGLHNASNAKAAHRRKRVECPKEPKANVRHRRYRKKQLGKLGAASKVRRIDPLTGKVLRERAQ